MDTEICQACNGKGEISVYFEFFNKSMLEPCRPCCGRGCFGGISTEELKRKMVTLQKNIAVKANDPRVNDYFRESYQGTIHALDLAMKHSTSENELLMQYENTKSNLSTLQMCVNRQIEDDENRSTAMNIEGGLKIPEQGQISLMFT